MKLSLITMLLCLTACAKATPAPIKPEPPQKPSQALCDKAYDNLLTNALNGTLEEGESFTQQQVIAGKVILDLQYRTDGRADLFFNVCLNKASVPLAECWTKATTLEGMDVCTMMWKDTIHK